MVHSQNTSKRIHLVGTINCGARESGHTVAQDGSIAPQQKHTQPAPEVVESLTFLLPSLAGKCSPQLPHLCLCCHMPAPKGLHCKRQESDALSPAVLGSPPHFELMGKGDLDLDRPS